MNPRRIYLASRNAHKLEELAAIIGPEARALGLDLRLASELGPDIDWVENGATFRDNALIKARTLRAHTAAAVLADDSGLVVDALDGAPGIHSQRYSPTGDAAGNNAKLLAALDAAPDAARRARFVCALAFIDETGGEHTFEGHCEGRIGRALRGRHGFGYDPLFLVDGTPHTMAELPPDEKNKMSHRANAVRHWMAFLASGR